MSLKNIRENYTRLLTAFKDAGVKLTESQKKDLDSFILALEGKMNQTKLSTIKATTKVVESKLEKEYRKVFESIMAHQQEHDELAGKIQNKITKINESKKIAHAVDGYLDTVLEEALPKRAIVDYDKMKRMESLVESLKDTLMINDESLVEKSAKLTEAFNKDKKALDAKISALEKKLNESLTREINLKKQINKKEAQELLDKKTKDLPLFEARTIKKRFAGASVEEIEKNFKKLLESVRKEMQEESEAETKSLEEEISEIIAKEDDSSEKEDAKGKEPVEENEEKDEVTEDEESDDAETMDECEDGAPSAEDEVSLDESEQIPSSFMQAWISRSKGITPIG